MKTIDVGFDQNVMIQLQSLIGKQFVCYKSDSFVFSPSVYGIVGIFLEDSAFKITNLVEAQDYYGKDEDVAIFRFEKAEPNSIHSFSDECDWVETPVNEKITAIRVVSETQQLFHNQTQTYEVHTPRGMVFQLESGREISFEKAVWFSEMITIRRGYNLIAEFAPEQEFIDGWEDSEEYTPKCSRKIITFGDWKDITPTA